jgi:hypothetical protein
VGIDGGRALFVVYVGEECKVVSSLLSVARGAEESAVLLPVRSAAERRVDVVVLPVKEHPGKSQA